MTLKKVKPMTKTQNFKQDPEKYQGEIRQKDFHSQYVKKIDELGISTVLELGCASGDFLYQLPAKVTGTGLDISKELINVAKTTRKKNNLEFFCADLFTYQPKQPFDLVVMTGFLCTFKDFNKVLDKALDLSNRYIFINDFFNSYGVDAQFSFKLDNEEEFQTPYTVWSKNTIIQYLKDRNVNYKFEQYDVHTELQEGPHPLHNFHVNVLGKRTISNRGGILLDGFNLWLEK